MTGDSKNKDRRFILVTAAVILCISLLTGGILVYAQQATRQGVLEEGKQMAQKEYMEGMYKDWNGLYKDSSFVSTEIARKVCEKYNLDYETVMRKEITGEISNYESAITWKAENSQESMEEFCSRINDIFAFSVGSSEGIIRAICDDSSLSYEQAVIGDLSIEQLMEIQKQAYETSDHPK